MAAGMRRWRNSSMISVSSYQDPGSRRRKAQTHKAKSGPLPAKFFSETLPADRIRPVYMQGQSSIPRSNIRSYLSRYRPEKKSQGTDEYKPDNHRPFDSGHGRMEPEIFSVFFLYWPSGFSREGFQPVGCCCSMLRTWTS
jgi:hypothetical protein